MKNFYFAITFLFTLIVHSQCPAGSVSFTSQAQINNFITQYPNCTTINGDVIIGGNITNLNGLANITNITGALEIREVSNLETLEGLENLETVGTDFILREVDDLISIEALSSLTSVWGEFTVRSCPELISLDGVENVTAVGLGLIIRDCESLISIEGLIGITAVGEILEIVSCPVLASLSGLENIESIAGGEEGALVIEGNDSLTSLEGLGSAVTIMAGGITISSNGDLSYCSVPAICNYLQNPPQDAIITIGLNVTGCNSDTEVLAACAPVEVPAITTFTPDSGCAGTQVIITGTGFSSVIAVTIGGEPVTNYIVNSTTQITAIAGIGNTGTIEVTNTSGTATSVAEFTITPSPEAPTGNTIQIINVNTAADATVANLEAVPAEDGIINWYASEEDAIAGENALTADVQLINGAAYYATQTIGDCTSIELFQITVEIILDMREFRNNEFAIYPNPVKDIAYLSMQDNIIVQSMALYDINGRVIRNFTTPDAKGLTTIVNLNGVEKGIYLLHIQSDEGFTVIKIYKQ